MGECDPNDASLDARTNIEIYHVYSIWYHTVLQQPTLHPAEVKSSNHSTYIKFKLLLAKTLTSYYSVSLRKGTLTVGNSGRGL